MRLHSRLLALTFLLVALASGPDDSRPRLAQLLWPAKIRPPGKQSASQSSTNDPPRLNAATRTATLSSRRTHTGAGTSTSRRRPRLESRLEALRKKLVFLQGGVETAEHAFERDEAALRACREREIFFAADVERARLELRELAMAAANHSAAYLADRRWRSAEGIMQRLTTDLRPKAEGLARRVIPQRLESLRGVQASCNDTRRSMARHRRTIADWQLIYLLTEVELKRLELAALAGNATQAELRRTLQHGEQSLREAGGGSSSNDINGGIDSSVAKNLVAELSLVINGGDAGTGIGTADGSGPSNTMATGSGVRKDPLPGAAALPVPVGSKPVSATTAASSSLSAAGALVPSASCGTVANCRAEALVFTAAATVNYQRATVACLALMAIHAKGIVSARKAFMPLRLQRVVRGQRAKSSSISLAEFDGKKSKRAGAAIAALCYFHDPILMHGCNKAVGQAIKKSSLTLPQVAMCTLVSLALKKEKASGVGACSAYYEATKESGPVQAKMMYEAGNAAKAAVDDLKDDITADMKDLTQKKASLAELMAAVSPPFGAPTLPKEANVLALQYTAEGRKNALYAANRLRQVALVNLQAACNAAGVSVDDALKNKLSLPLNSPVRAPIEAAQLRYDKAVTEEKDAQTQSDHAGLEYLAGIGRAPVRATKASKGSNGGKRSGKGGGSGGASDGGGAGGAGGGGGAGGDSADGDSEEDTEDPPPFKPIPCPPNTIFCPALPTPAGHAQFWATFQSRKSGWAPSGAKDPKKWTGSDADAPPAPPPPSLLLEESPASHGMGRPLRRILRGGGRRSLAASSGSSDSASNSDAGVLLLETATSAAPEAREAPAPDIDDDIYPNLFYPKLGRILAPAVEAEMARRWDDWSSSRRLDEGGSYGEVASSRSSYGEAGSDKSVVGRSHGEAGTGRRGRGDRSGEGGDPGSSIPAADGGEGGAIAVSERRLLRALRPAVPPKWRSADGGFFPRRRRPPGLSSKRRGKRGPPAVGARVSVQLDPTTLASLHLTAKSGAPTSKGGPAAKAAATFDGRVLAVKGDPAHPTSFSVSLADGTVVESLSSTQVSAADTGDTTEAGAGAGAGAGGGDAGADSAEGSGSRRKRASQGSASSAGGGGGGGAAADLEGALTKFKLKALAAAGSAMPPKKLKPLVLAALQRLPASLVQVSSGVKCDCLCPVPGHPTLTAGDCGEVARIEFDEAEANAKLSAAMSKSFSASTRFRVMEGIAQASQAIAGPRVSFADPEPSSKVDASSAV